MVEVKIYPACLKCDCSKFVGRTEPANPWTFEEQKYNAYIKCEYENVCKFIDGQEPIKIGK